MWEARGRGELRRYGVHAVKGTGEDEVVVGGELRQARMELAIVYQTSRFGDDHEGKHDPERY